MSPLVNDSVSAAVVVAHPGHELLIYHYLEQNRPLYFCLTDGSGGKGQSRLASTGRVLQGVGALPGSIYGRFSDKEVYRLLLDGRVEVFIDLLDELAGSLIEANIQCVAGDAMEGFNPVHDLCRALIDRAVAVVRMRTGRVLQNYEFTVHGHPVATSEDALVRLELDESALDRKIDVAMTYRAVQGEVEDALDRFGKGAFAVECLRSSSAKSMLEQFESTPPAYESIGESRVSEGRYREVVRYREHVLPVISALGIAIPDSALSHHR